MEQKPEPDPDIVPTVVTNANNVILNANGGGFGNMPLLTQAGGEDRDYSSVLSYSFPQKLYLLLSNDRTGSIEWLEDGLAFRIVNKDVFVNTVIPKYFKQTCLASFIRQLNVYGFQKINKGMDANCFFHSKFRRDRPYAIHEMNRRQPGPTTRKRRAVAGASIPAKSKIYSSASSASSDERHQQQQENKFLRRHHSFPSDNERIGSNVSANSLQGEEPLVWQNAPTNRNSFNDFLDSSNVYESSLGTYLQSFSDGELTPSNRCSHHYQQQLLSSQYANSLYQQPSLAEFHPYQAYLPDQPVQSTIFSQSQSYGVSATSDPYFNQPVQNFMDPRSFPSISSAQMSVPNPPLYTYSCAENEDKESLAIEDGEETLALLQQLLFENN